MMAYWSRHDIGNTQRFGQITPAKGGQVKVSRTSVNRPKRPGRNNKCNDPSEIQSTACGADGKIAYLRGNMV